MKSLFHILAVHPSLPLWIRALGTTVAGWITLMAVAQLFTYEKFPGVLDGLWQTGGEMLAYLLAAAIVVCEVFSLPYLLSMRVTPLIRAVSLVCGWFVALFWLAVALWRLAIQGEQINVGYLGATVPLTNEWLVLGLAIVLMVGVASLTALVLRRAKTA